MCSWINCFGTSEAYATIIAAFIGLIGGLSALIGAVWVASRQSRILEKQTDIASRMAEIEELKLRSDLYERRMEIFNATRSILSAAALVRKAPGMDRTTEGDIFSPQLLIDFQAAINSAEFLFGEKTNVALEGILQLLVELSFANEMVDSAVGDDALESRLSSSDRVLKAVRDIGFLNSNLPDVFPELKMSRHGGR